MQEANARKRLADFPLLPAVFAMANGEAAPTGTALDLCFQAGSILSIVLDLDRQDSNLSKTDIQNAIGAATSLIKVAQALDDVSGSHEE